jgi:hypothetical protein
MLLVGVLLHLDKPIPARYVASMPIDARLPPVHTPISRLERVDKLGMLSWVQQHPDALLPIAFHGSATRIPHRVATLAHMRTNMRGVHTMLVSRQISTESYELPANGCLDSPPSRLLGRLSQPSYRNSNPRLMAVVFPDDLYRSRDSRLL